jgi:hypothetical protein
MHSFWAYLISLDHCGRGGAISGVGLDSFGGGDPDRRNPGSIG